MLLFGTPEGGGNFAVAPHTWTRLKTTSFDIGELQVSDWYDNVIGYASQYSNRSLMAADTVEIKGTGAQDPLGQGCRYCRGGAHFA